MRRWYVPLTVLGVGGVGAFLLSERGRNVVRLLLDNFREAPERLLEWNDNAQDELDRIQEALNRIAENLGTSSSNGRITCPGAGYQSRTTKATGKRPVAFWFAPHV